MSFPDPKYTIVLITHDWSSYQRVVCAHAVLYDTTGEPKKFTHVVHRGSIANEQGTLYQEVWHKIAVPALKEKFGIEIQAAAFFIEQPSAGVLKI